MVGKTALAVASLGLCLFAREADAAEPEPPTLPKHRIVYEELLGLRVNPIGIEDQYLLAFRERLFKSDSLALRDNHFSVGLSPTLSPAISRFGGNVEIKPLSILALQAGFYQASYNGSFGTLQSFPSAASDYSDTQLSLRKKAGLHHPTMGFEVHLRGTALGKLGPVAFRSETNAYYTSQKLQQPDTVYYSPRLDLIMPNRGWVLTSDEDVAYLSSFGLVAGARFSTSTPFVSGPGDPGSNLRLGPLLAYTFFDHPHASFNKPTVLGICQWWLAHPYRTGQDVSQAIPYVVLALRFEGELWSAE